jgi:hypothetical protein
MKDLIAALLAVMVLFALGAASAHAALPEFSGEFPTRGEATNGMGSEHAGGTITISCAKSEGKFEVTGAKGGTFDELFLECKESILGKSFGCQGLIDTIAGSILLKGTVTLGYALGTLTPLVALTIEQVHYECNFLNVARGCVLGTTTLSKSKTGTLAFHTVSGNQEYTDYTNDKGEAKECKLEGSINGEPFAPWGEVQEAHLVFNKELEVKD